MYNWQYVTCHTIQYPSLDNHLSIISFQGATGDDGAIGIIGPSGQRVSNRLKYHSTLISQSTSNTCACWTEFKCKHVNVRDPLALLDHQEKKEISVHLEQWGLLDLEVTLEILDQWWGFRWCVWYNFCLLWDEIFLLIKKKKILNQPKEVCWS